MKPAFYRIFVAAVACACVCLSAGNPAHALQDRDPVAEPSATDEAGAEDLRRTLDYLTDIATRSRLNADDTPGMVTVLYGRDLEERGIRTVAEAMSLVPGMRLALTNENVWRMVIRGVPRAFASGHVKILLDGTPLSTAFGVDPVPNMPIEQVDRIEIVRGPVSVIHGEFADAGVMNIITRKNGNRIHGGVGQYGVRTAGGLASAEDKDGFVRMSLNVAGQNADGATLYASSGITGDMEGDAAADDASDADELAGDAMGTEDEFFDEHEGGEDVFAAGPEVNSYDGDKTYRSGIAALQLGPLDLQAHRFVNRQPDFYDARLEGFRARHRIDASERVRVNWSMGWQTSRFDSGNAFKSLFDLETPPGECLYGYNYDERQFHGNASVTADVLESQTLMLEGDFSETALEDVTQGDGVGAFRYDGRRRRLASLTLQDEFRPISPLILTAGFRYDHYDDIGDYTSPRLAAAWRIDPYDISDGRHVFKAQIARSYRPPTFMEMIINDEPGIAWQKDQTGRADALEFGYIYRSTHYLGRVTLFHSRIEPGQGDDVLDEGNGDIRSGGGEAELEVALIPEKLMFDGNVSLVALTNDSDRVNDWMANVSLTARPFRPLALSVLYRFEDPYRPLENGDAEEDASMDEIHRIDLTATLTLRKLRGIALRLGVKNIAKADIRYPSLYNSDCHVPEVGEAYTSKEQRLERWWWTSLEFDF